MAGYKGTGVRFGGIPKGAGLFVDSNLAREADRISRTQGQFTTNAQEALTDAHYKMARIMQQYQVDALQDSIEDTGRPQRTNKGRLRRSILDERNTILRANGWAVGIPAWLNQSPAGAYWRVIEEGTGPYDTDGLFFRDREGTVVDRPASDAGSRSALMLLQFASPAARTIHVSGIEPRQYMRKGTRRWSQSNIRTVEYRDAFRRYGFGDYLTLRGEARGRR